MNAIRFWSDPHHRILLCGQNRAVTETFEIEVQREPYLEKLTRMTPNA